MDWADLFDFGGFTLNLSPFSPGVSIEHAKNVGGKSPHFQTFQCPAKDRGLQSILLGLALGRNLRRIYGNVGKTMSCLPAMTGNGYHIPPIYLW